MEESRPAHDDQMRSRSLFLLLAAATAGVAVGQPPPGYYDAAEGLTGQALRQALYGIIYTHNVHQYSDLWTDFQSTDVRGDGMVWDIYSDVPGGTSPYSYTFVTNQCGSYNSEGDCYNREHSVPQTWFNGASPMYTDLFHMYPVDGWVNNKRGELPYGEVGSVDWTSQNGSKTGSSATPGYNGTVFEPIDDFKGDLARSYFYMMTCYMSFVNTWSSPMFTADDLSPWAEAQLLAWSDADPVSAKEISRNNAIYALQNNRNPFIDRPEWIHYIWGPTAGIAIADQQHSAFWYYDGAFYSAGARSRTVAVSDATGKQVALCSFMNGSAKVPHLPTGIYFAHFGDRVLRFVR